MIVIDNVSLLQSVDKDSDMEDSGAVQVAEYRLTTMN